MVSSLFLVGIKSSLSLKK